ncbi:MAG: DUF2318 domain-containing protein [Lachnospiraceae bacterium]|nr:DUF2318 domain-containing protein [Lachnospiraceae bacterium]
MANKNHKNEIRAKESKKYFSVAVAAIALICAAVIFFTNGNKAGEQKTADIPDDATVVIGQGESLVIPISEITDEASFFPIKVDGENMEVLAVRASDGSIRTAFNTCQSCYTSGAGFYSFEDGDLVCNNCGFHFSPDQVEVASGGCNPWPIFAENKTVTDDSISISYDFLSASKEIFANWKMAFK